MTLPDKNDITEQNQHNQRNEMKLIDLKRMSNLIRFLHDGRRSCGQKEFSIPVELQQQHRQQHGSLGLQQ